LQVVKPDSVNTGREGEVVGGAAKGAAIGAVAGGLAGRGTRQQKRAAQKQQAERKADAANQSQIDNFTKAYKACLTGKGYTAQ
jgi:hypothetical protein